MQAISGGELVLGDLRMPGLDLATVACSAVPSGGIATANSVLCISVDGMPPQELHMRVRPGAPACLLLEPGHPWAEVRPSAPDHRCRDMTWQVWFQGARGRKRDSTGLNTVH